MDTANVTGLLDLAESISRNAMIITKHHLSTSSPVPSFDLPQTESNAKIQPSKEPQVVHDARAELIVAASDISTLVAGPGGFLRSLSYSYHDITALAVLLEFDIANHVPLEGDISFAALSSKAGFDEQRLERILRLLFVKKIFRESRLLHVAHTTISAELKNNKALAAFLGHCTFEAFPAASRLSDSLRRYPHTQEPNETGFNLAMNTGDPLFTYLTKNPARFDRFNLGMAGISQAIGRSAQQVVDGYPWDSLGEVTVVDVGGGNGHVSVALAHAYPNLKLIVQDLPGALVGAEEQVPKEVADRVSFQAHDMFEMQPVADARIYYLRHVLHDWPDHYAVKILQKLIPKMHPDSRILISDSVIPPPGVLHGLDEKLVRYLDLQMMVLHNARERTEEDWAAMFKTADPRLKLQKVWRKGESVAASTIIEGQLV
ncbi:hypothetical protein MMC30_004370 [Trapelia coarctata]|nr:hypothetical protein [Trapelia coarctata]